MRSRVSIQSAEASAQSLTPEAARLVRQLDEFKPLAEQKRMVRDLIAMTGTVVDLNDRDVYGGGDQTPITTEHHAQVFRGSGEVPVT